MKESKIVRAKKDLEYACGIAGWECKNDDSRIMYIRQVLKFYDKLLFIGDSQGKTEEAIGLNRDARGIVQKAINGNKYLTSHIDSMANMNKFSMLIKKYYELVKEGKQADLTGKRGEEANYRMIKELANDILPNNLGIF
jgi:hypothetical protein